MNARRFCQPSPFAPTTRWIQTRRLRFDAANTKLPNVLWFVVFASAIISLNALFFAVRDADLGLGPSLISLSTTDS
jgi:hypothetical protein